MSVDVPVQIESALDSFALRAGRSREQVVAEALDEYLSEQEDLLIAAQVRNDVEEGRTTTISLEELMDRYGVER